MTYDSRVDTLLHIERVKFYLANVRNNLYLRGDRHDASKLEGREKEAFDVIAPRLSEVEYGSDEYKANLREMKPAIEEHYSKNSHHPEHFDNGIDGMSLMDLLEMLCDWKAAGERHRPKVEAVAGERSGEQSSLLKSLDHNIQRFDIEPQLASILRNTIIEMDWS